MRRKQTGHRSGARGAANKRGTASGRPGDGGRGVGLLLPKTVPVPGRRLPPVSADVAPVLMALEICLPEPPVLRREMARWGEAGLLTSGSTVRLRLPGKLHQWPNAAVVPGYSGGTVPEFHGIPLAPTHRAGQSFSEPRLTINPIYRRGSRWDKKGSSWAF